MSSGRNRAPAPKRELRSGGADVVHRVTGDVEIGFFRGAGAFHRERDIASGARLPGAEHILEEGAEPDVPQPGPGLAKRQSRAARVSCTEDRSGGIVVERQEIRAPQKKDLRPRGQQNAQSADKARGPVPRRAEGGGRPVEIAHARAHLATSSQAPMGFDGCARNARLIHLRRPCCASMARPWQRVWRCCRCPCRSFSGARSRSRDDFPRPSESEVFNESTAPSTRRQED